MKLDRSWYDEEWFHRVGCIIHSFSFLSYSLLLYTSTLYTYQKSRFKFDQQLQQFLSTAINYKSIFFMVYRCIVYSGNFRSIWYLMNVWIRMYHPSISCDTVCVIFFSFIKLSSFLKQTTNHTKAKYRHFLKPVLPPLLIQVCDMFYHSSSLSLLFSPSTSKQTDYKTREERNRQIKSGRNQVNQVKIAPTSKTPIEK